MEAYYRKQMAKAMRMAEESGALERALAQASVEGRVLQSRSRHRCPGRAWFRCQRSLRRLRRSCRGSSRLQIGRSPLCHRSRCPSRGAAEGHGGAEDVRALQHQPSAACSGFCAEGECTASCAGGKCEEEEVGARSANWQHRPLCCGAKV